MAVPATLTGRAAGPLQAALYYSRKGRRSRVAGTPRASVAPAITGTATVGEELSVSDGTWTSSPTLYRYIWRRDGAVIADADQSTYTLVEADEGADINCTVLASNASGVAGATSDAVGPIAAA